MKKNKIEKKTGLRGFVALLAILLVAAIAIGLFMAYSTLRDMWLEQCVITNGAEQIQVTSGKLVKADTIADAFGLRNGANLALIDFAARRRDVLNDPRYAAIRDISIERSLPNKVSISVVEREPVVRMNIRGQKPDTGHVADADGVVFTRRRGTGLLPIVREPQAPGTAVGKQLSGRALAALRLVETCRLPELQELGLLEVDISKQDFLCATLGDYSTAKIAWPGMDDPDSSSLADLFITLRNLRDAIRSKVGQGVKTWNATSKEYIYADTKEKIP
jgi:hypothetical protein